MKAPCVFMTADAVGGVWTYAADLAAELADAGWRVSVAVLGPNPSHDQIACMRQSGAEVLETGLPLDWTGAAAGALARGARAVAALARMSGASIVHLNTPALAAHAVFSAPVVGACHSCLATWWTAMRDEPPPPDFVAHADTLRRAYQRCAALIAPSAAFAKATAAAYGVRPRVVHNGRAAGRRRASMRKAPFALTAGRLWDEGKNVALVDGAAARMRHPLFAAGDTRGPNGAEVRLRAACAVGRLPRSTLDGWLNRAGVFVSLSRYEPFGLGVLEAAQAGCALVLSDIPSFRELWAGAAVFVEPTDERAIAAAIDGLIEHEPTRAAWGHRAGRRAETFSRAAMGRATLAAYRDVRAVSDWGRVA